ncbi:AraC family ligand binding domain-containing protein [Parendozoicomonas sp. Alg238-R29]|uniref:AraC family ligand binding domain-containing protein n=1 Tax=Parendozoicomonas sp. Alg238-R29 TaxID=2993446 RepID=UPI00248DE8F9|nr:AraC family ligand binding domain-containing protein [Parendozoicomonas sp. Alg238-R29]
MWKNVSREKACIIRADDLGGIDLLKASYRTQTFSRHVHEGYCIGVIAAGAQQFYRTGSHHVAPVGSIILVNADEVHTGHAASEGGWSYRAIYPHVDIFEGGNESALKAPWFREAVVHDPDMTSKLSHLFDTVEHSDNRLERETIWLETMCQLTRRYSCSRSHSLLDIDCPALFTINVG